jgi:hypothetical protein
MHVPRFFVVSLLILAPACLRMWSVEWNVVPIGALALFCGAYFRNRALAFAVPLLAMLAGDVLLAVQTHNSQLYLFHTLMPLVYACYVVSVTMGIALRTYWDRLDEGLGERQSGRSGDGAPRYSGLRTRVVPIASLTIAGSILFFVVTNFGCWWCYSMYPKSWQGLAQCYVAGIPFFRGTLCGDLIGSAILFGGELLLRHHAMPVPETERF